MSKYLWYMLSFGCIILTSCNSGSTTIINQPCTYPEFNQQIAENLINSWAQGLQKYNSKLNPDIYISAGYFTMNYYTPDAVLLPTVSKEQRQGTQEIYNYFMSFLSHNPQMILPDSSENIAQPLGCGYGDYHGYYDFILDPGTSTQSITHARFSFIFRYIPESFTSSFQATSGSGSGVTYRQTNLPGWYISRQQSSMLPPKISDSQNN